MTVPIERECTPTTDIKSHCGTLRTLWSVEVSNGSMDLLDETVIETSVANKCHRFSLDWNKRTRLTVDRIFELNEQKSFDRFQVHPPLFIINGSPFSYYM